MTQQTLMILLNRSKLNKMFASTNKNFRGKAHILLWILKASTRLRKLEAFHGR